MIRGRAVLSGMAMLACAVCEAQAESQAQLGIEMKLTSAGFRMRTANTSQELARLRTIPPHRFVARAKNGVRYYVYADPDGCRCALIGDRQAMNAYRDMVAPPPLAPGVQDFEGAGSDEGVDPERQMIHDMDHDADTLTSDDILHPGF
jgi:hypothetical protein